MATASVFTTYGPGFLGLSIAMFFQGVLSVQSYVYDDTFPEDSLTMKSLMVGVWCTDLLHLGLVTQGTYNFLVFDWGIFSPLSFAMWALLSHIVLVMIGTIICQSIFFHRIHIFSDGSKIIIIVLAALCMVTFLLDMSASLQDIKRGTIEEYKAFTAKLIVILSVADIITALSLSCYLQHSQGGFRKYSEICSSYRLEWSTSHFRQNSVAARLVLYSVSAFLVSGFLAVACFIAYFASPERHLFITVHLALGRTYTNGLLGILNSCASSIQSLHEQPRLREFVECKGSDSSATNRSGFEDQKPDV